MISTQTFLTLSASAFICAVIASVYISVLANEKILNWWFKWGMKFQYKKGIYERQHMNGERWYWKIIWGCEKCFAGQLALWGYLFTAITVRQANYGRFTGLSLQFQYNLLHHIFIVCFSILLTILITRQINK